MTAKKPKRKRKATKPPDKDEPIKIPDLPDFPFVDDFNYLVSTAYVFCQKCNEVLLTPEQGKELVEQAKKEWIREKVWKKHPVHARDTIITCLKCDTQNFLTFVIQRYKTEDETYIYSRYRFWSVLFPNRKEQLEHHKTLTKYFGY